jgi:AcrR family transcriptional regulator
VADSKTKPGASGLRGEPLRRSVIDAAERLLRQGKAEFSMRDLAAEAGVSFATPFNQFGSKAAIMHAVAGRRVDVMEARFKRAARPGDVLDGVLLAVEAAVTVMLEEPIVNRSVMGWLGTAGPTAGQAWARSKALWSLALGDGDGIAPHKREHALQTLPGHLAFGFRGVLSFWTAGEVADLDLAARARDVAIAMMLGVLEDSDRHRTFAGTPVAMPT